MQTPELTAAGFVPFFEALWSEPGSVRHPFAWQTALARRLIENTDDPWPEAIALPTAAGKTACLDIALYALAASVQIEGGRVLAKAPRRIFFVVDRRVIVDEAYDRAKRLAAKLRAAESGIVQIVAERLRLLARGQVAEDPVEDRLPVEPLAVYQLRGGMHRSEAWARSPLQPFVVASTVDQIGSRLLFRAYGRGPGMWPVYAGLVANESLILLDEAHCARPFMETLHAVACYRGHAREKLGACFHPVVMSATPPQNIKDVFRDESDEPTRADHPLGRRQLARKPAALIAPVKPGAVKKVDRFAAKLAGQARMLAQEGRKAIVVFVNRVATARAVHALLRPEHDAVLLTGRMRPFDKDDVVTQRLAPLSADASAARVLEHPVFVVATQTLEVGANLDFDGLVTECASLDALRQRFGRLNRMGRNIAGCDAQGCPLGARAAILIREDQAKDSKDDPVYGEALALTWAWLRKFPGEVDFGVAHLAPRLPQGEDLAEFSAPSAEATVMLPAHLDVLAQTSPIPKPSPELSFFLRGPGHADADVQVCWRADISLSGEGGDDDNALEVLTRCPPASPECVAVPIARFKRWLEGQSETDHSSDLEGEALAGDADQDHDEEKPRRRRFVVRWRGRDDAKVIDTLGEVRPGDVLVIPAKEAAPVELGDLAPDQNGAPTLDWGDRAFRAMRAKALLRLNPDLIASWPAEESLRTELREFATTAWERLENGDAEVMSDLKAALRRLGKLVVPSRSWAWLPEVAASLAGDRRLERDLTRHPFGGLILRGSRKLEPSGEPPDVFSDEHDASASGTVRVRLKEHLPGVAAFARRHASAAGLPDALIQTLERAGLLHDLGKADPRFQSLLRGGIRFLDSELLAKSDNLPQGRAAYAAATKRAGYPQGGRHELLSVRLAQSAPTLLPSDELSRDLVLHLVASHHGRCRPFAPVILDEAPLTVRCDLLGNALEASSATGLEQLDSGVSERYWKLVRHYGWWGLAWLEALLRLADHRRSELEQVLAQETVNA